MAPHVLKSPFPRLGTLKVSLHTHSAPRRERVLAFWGCGCYNRPEPDGNLECWRDGNAVVITTERWPAILDFHLTSPFLCAIIDRRKRWQTSNPENEVRPLTPDLLRIGTGRRSTSKKTRLSGLLVQLGVPTSRPWTFGEINEEPDE